MKGDRMLPGVGLSLATSLVQGLGCRVRSMFWLARMFVVSS